MGCSDPPGLESAEEPGDGGECDDVRERAW